MKKFLIGAALAVVLTAGATTYAQTVSMDRRPITAEQVYQLLLQYVAEIHGQIAHLQKQIDNIQLIPGPQGNPGPQGPAGPQLMLKDRAGQSLGSLIGTDVHDFNSERFTTYIKNLGVFMEYASDGAARTVKVNNLNSVTLFDDLNCHGHPYFRGSGHGTYFVVREFGPRYFKDLGENSTPTPTIIKSYFSGDQCVNLPPELFNDARPVAEIHMPFTEPLAWPLRIQEQ